MIYSPKTTFWTFQGQIPQKPWKYRVLSLYHIVRPCVRARVCAFVYVCVSFVFRLSTNIEKQKAKKINFLTFVLKSNIENESQKIILKFVARLNTEKTKVQNKNKN